MYHCGECDRLSQAKTQFRLKLRKKLLFIYMDVSTTGADRAFKALYTVRYEVEDTIGIFNSVYFQG